MYHYTQHTLKCMIKLAWPNANGHTVWYYSSITSAKRWVAGVRKWQFLMIYSTVNHQRGGWVGLKNSKTWWRNTWMVPKNKAKAQEQQRPLLKSLYTVGHLLFWGIVLRIVMLHLFFGDWKGSDKHFWDFATFSP